MNKPREAGSSAGKSVCWSSLPEESKLGWLICLFFLQVFEKKIKLFPEVVRKRSSSARNTELRWPRLRSEQSKSEWKVV